MIARRTAGRALAAIDSVARRVADAAVQIGVPRWSKRDMFLLGLFTAGLTVAGFHQPDQRPVDVVFAFALVPVDTWAGKIAAIAVAVVFLLGFLFWSRRAGSASFFRGVLAGTGSVLSVDIVLIHWIFGLHHVTNTQMDVLLEPLLVLLGLGFLWFAITRERRGPR